MAVIEFGRHVLGYEDATSSEFSETTKHPVIALMPDQMNITDKGGTMRLGKYPCVLTEGSRSRELYGEAEISERHRHRFEFNDEYRAQFEKMGMRCVGENPETHLVEVVEVPKLKWYIGTQYHPEYSSTVLNPHPLFMSFVKAAIANKASKK